LWKTEQDKIILLYEKLHILKVETDPELVISTKKDFIDLYMVTGNPDPTHTKKFMDFLEEVRKGVFDYNCYGW